MCLDDRCVEMRGGRAAGAQQRRRHAGRQRDAECGERRRTLVVEDVHVDVGPSGQRQRHRRAPRTRGDDGVTQSVAHPFVDQRGAERGLHVLRRRGHDRHDTGLSSSMCVPTSRSRSGRTSSARGATSANVASRPPSPSSPTRSTSTSSSAPTNSIPLRRRASRAGARGVRQEVRRPRARAGRSSIMSPRLRPRAASSSGWIAPCAPTRCSPIGCCGSLRATGHQVAMKERLLQAYFIDGLDIGDPDVLADVRRRRRPRSRSGAGVPRQRRRVAEVRDEMQTGRRDGDHRRADLRVRRQVDGARRARPGHVRAGLAPRRRQAHRGCLTGAHCAGKLAGWTCGAGPAAGLRARLHPDRELVEADRRPASPPTATRRSWSTLRATATAPNVRADLRRGADMLTALCGFGVYVGYSLGGRLCMHAALMYPAPRSRTRRHRCLPRHRRRERTCRSPGGRQPARRSHRRCRRRRLPRRMARPTAVRRAHTRRRGRAPIGSRNTAEGLASSLRLAGTGAQGSLWPRLREMNMPVLTIAGELDEKFAAIGRQIAGIGARRRVRRDTRRGPCRSSPGTPNRSSTRWTTWLRKIKY